MKHMYELDITVCLKSNMHACTHLYTLGTHWTQFTYAHYTQR